MSSYQILKEKYDKLLAESNSCVCSMLDVIRGDVNAIEDNLGNELCAADFVDVRAAKLVALRNILSFYKDFLDS